MKIDKKLKIGDKYMKDRTVNKILSSMGLKMEDVFEPDLNKQYENYKLLCKILNTNDEEEREKLLQQADMQINS